MFVTVRLKGARTIRQRLRLPQPDEPEFVDGPAGDLSELLCPLRLAHRNSREIAGENAGSHGRSLDGTGPVALSVGEQFGVDEELDRPADLLLREVDRALAVAAE